MILLRWHQVAIRNKWTPCSSSETKQNKSEYWLPIKPDNKSEFWLPIKPDKVNTSWWSTQREHQLMINSKWTPVDDQLRQCEHQLIINSKWTPDDDQLKVNTWEWTPVGNQIRQCEHQLMIKSDNLNTSNDHIRQTELQLWSNQTNWTPAGNQTNWTPAGNQIRQTEHQLTAKSDKMNTSWQSNRTKWTPVDIQIRQSEHQLAIISDKECRCAKKRNVDVQCGSKSHMTFSTTATFDPKNEAREVATNIGAYK